MINEHDIRDRAIEAIREYPMYFAELFDKHDLCDLLDESFIQRLFGREPHHMYIHPCRLAIYMIYISRNFPDRHISELIALDPSLVSIEMCVPMTIDDYAWLFDNGHAEKTYLHQGRCMSGAISIDTIRWLYNRAPANGGKPIRRFHVFTYYDGIEGDFPEIECDIGLTTISHPNISFIPAARTLYRYRADGVVDIYKPPSRDAIKKIIIYADSIYKAGKFRPNISLPIADLCELYEQHGIQCRPAALLNQESFTVADMHRLNIASEFVQGGENTHIFAKNCRDTIDNMTTMVHMWGLITNKYTDPTELIHRLYARNIMHKVMGIIEQTETAYRIDYRVAIALEAEIPRRLWPRMWLLVDKPTISAMEPPHRLRGDQREHIHDFVNLLLMHRRAADTFALIVMYCDAYITIRDGYITIRDGYIAH